MVRSAVLPLVVLASLAAPPASALPPVAEKLRGLERRDGFMPWAYDPGSGRLLLEVSRVGEEFLYGAGIAAGAGTVDVSLDRGQLGELGLCAFERSGPRLLLRRRQLAHRAGVAERERARVVEESFATSVIAALPIVAESGRRLLVDATSLVAADAPQVARALKEAGQGEWRFQEALAAFHPERSGAFPRNTELQATLTFTSDAAPPALAAALPDGRTLSLRVHHTFLALPEPGYEPRAHDPRVGYFTTSFLDHAAPFGEPLLRQWITRWRLEKQDPAAVLSAPVRPIVLHLDRGLPEPERSAVREAALWWNRAFEEAGFRDAIELRDLPEGASFLDARYSGIQWTSRAERAWSIGQFQTDPRTGEILHGVVILDSHRRRTTARQWQNFAPPGARRCAAGGAPAPDPATLAAAADAPEVTEQELVLARLQYLTAHEVGHILGIGHNMAATTYGWGSVMDYLGPRLEAREGGLDLANAYPRDVGAYDRLAVRYGYTPGLDRADLALMVRAAHAAGVVYPHDSDARWSEYDFGADAIAGLQRERAVRDVMLQRFGPGQLRPGEPLHDLQTRWNLAYLHHRFALLAAIRWIGGEFVANALARDGQVPRAPLAAEWQRAALEAVLDALEPAALRIPPAIEAALVPPPDGTPRSREQFAAEAGDAFSPLAAQRALAALVVEPLLDPQRAARLTLAPEGALGLPELLDRLIARSWRAPAGRDRDEARARRIVQRAVLDGLLRLATREGATPEVRAAAWSALSRLGREIEGRRGGDAEAEAHLRLAAAQVRAFLAEPSRSPLPPAPVPPGRPIGAGR